MVNVTGQITQAGEWGEDVRYKVHSKMFQDLRKAGPGF